MTASLSIFKRYSVIFTIFFAFLLPFTLNADPFPPQIDSNATGAHYAPVAWPAEDEWKNYSRFGNSINDPRTQDPSNGGTAPQNYVNIASSCTDTAEPSVYYYLHQDLTDPAKDVIMFRWRVEQIANTYATGPNAGSYSSGDAWNSALWTVLFDIDGDGVRDLAAHLDGSSGSPSEPIDMIYGIYGNIPTQSVNYTEDPNIHLIGHNPTAFVGTDNKIQNFHNSLTPDVIWSNGSDETVWDYGTTRSSVNVDSPCTEYYIDYQIPMGLIDASSFGGPTLTRETPISMIFCTSNSLNNPFQKDCAINATWTADPDKPAPFGDYISFDKNESYTQVIVDDITGVGCNPVTLTATVKDVIAIVDGEAESSIKSVDFYVYRDTNGDGIANDDDNWTLAVAGTQVDFTTWTADWQSEELFAGQYLVGVQAKDDPSKVDDDMDTNGTINVTFSYLDEGNVTALGTPPAGETWWANPEITGVKSIGLAVNNCGIAPTLDKSVNNAEPTVGETITFTLEFSNPELSPDTVTLFELSDTLPTGFVYNGNLGGTLASSVTSAPSIGDTGKIIWDINSFDGVPFDANTSQTLTFEVNASDATGLYNNVANSISSFGEVRSNVVPVSVGSPLLNIAISADKVLYNEGETVFYTVTYGNDSPVSTTNTIVEVNITGLSVSSPSNISDGGTYDAGTGLITWNVGSLPSGSGANNFTFEATVNNPFSSVDNPIIMPATIDSDQTNLQTATATVMVDVPTPNLIIQKSANKTFVNPADAANNQVIYTITYANTGTGPATDVNITDHIPTGFTYVSSTGTKLIEPTVGFGGTIVWSIATPFDENLPGSVTLTLEVSASNINTSSTNTAVISASNIKDSKEDNVTIGIFQTPATCHPITSIFDSTDFSTSTSNVNTRDYIDGTVSTYDEYLLPTSNTYVLDQNQTYKFSGNGDLILLGNTVTDVNFTIDLMSAKIDEAKIMVYSSGVKLGESVLSTQSSGNGGGDPIPTNINLYNMGVDTNSELNNLEIVLVGWSNNSPAGNRKMRTDYVQLCSTQTVATVPNLHLQYEVDKLNATVLDSLLYTVAYGNSGSADATATEIKATVPAELENIIPSDAGTYNALTGVITWSAIDIVSGGTGTLTFTADINNSFTGDSLASTSTLTHASSSTSLAANVLTQLEGIVVVAGGTPNIILQKEANTTSLIPGDIVLYTITVINAGTATATNLIVTDDIPANTYFKYVTGSITGGDSTSSSTADTLIWDISALTPGASTTLTYELKVDATGVASGVTTHDNSVTSVDDNGSSTGNTVTVTISTNPNLSIVKTVSNPTAKPGELVTYTIVVSNTGSGESSDTTVNDPIPDNMIFESSNTGSFDGVNNAVIFDVGTLTAGASTTLTFEASVKSVLPQGSTVITNTAVVTASNAASRSDSAIITSSADIDLSVNIFGPRSAAYPTAIIDQNATGSDVLSVNDASQFTLGQVIYVDSQYVTITVISGNIITLDTPVDVTVGDEVIGSVTYNVIYENHGDADAVDTNLTVVLPSGILYYDAASTPGSAPTQGTDGNVTWNLGTVGSGDSGSFQIIAFPSATGSYTINTNIVSTDTVDNAEANNADTITTIFGGLKVEKSTSTPTIVQPASGFTADVNYTITIYNTLPKIINDVNVTDSLPAGFEYSATASVLSYESNNTATDIIGSTTINTEPAQPVWGTIDVPANGKVEIKFTAIISDSVGSATYQNAVYTLTSEANTSVTQYDELSHPDEDVTVLNPTDALVEGYIFEDKNGNDIFDSGDIPYVNMEVTIADDSNPGFYYSAFTNGSGYFSRVVVEGNWTISHDTSNISLSLASGFSNPTLVVVPAGGSVLDLNPYVDFVANPSIALIKTVASISGDGSIGETITYNFEVNNTGNVDLTNITLTDVNASVTGGQIDLAAGAGDNTTFSATHIITASDLAAGKVINQALVTGTPPSGPDVNDTSDDNSTTEDDPTVVDVADGLASANPSIALEKTGIFMDENNDGYANVGETVSYEFNITNIGNVTLYDINITDDNAVVSGGPIVRMLPGESDVLTFTGIHTITYADIIDGVVLNQAVVTAQDSNGNDVNDTSDDPQNPVNVDDDNDSEPDDVTSTGLPIKPPTSTDDAKEGITGEDVTITIVNNDEGGTFALDATTVTLIEPVGVTDVVYDNDGDVIGFTVPGEGRWNVDETTGEVTFSPEDGFVVDPTPIEYTIEDEQGNETTAVISINYPPVANDDNATAEMNEVVTLDVLANDQNTSDPLDPTTVRFIGPDGNETETLYVLNKGTCTVESNGSVTFDPDLDFNGDLSIKYVVRDTNSDVSNEATITIRYPDFPIAKDDVTLGFSIATDNLNIPITEYAPTVIDVLANGDDWGSNGPGTQIITFTQPTYGEVSLDDNGTPEDPTDDVLIYTPAPDINNVTDSFTYTITDTLGFTSSANVTLNIDCATSQSSDGGDALNVVSMFLFAIMTAMIGLYFVRKEEERGEA